MGICSLKAERQSKSASLEDAQTNLQQRREQIALLSEQLLKMREDVKRDAGSSEETFKVGFRGEGMV